MLYPKDERHVACLITGEEGAPFPHAQWPRLSPSMPPLFLLVGLEDRNPERWDFFGGRRQPGDLTGVASVRHRLKEQVGTDLMPHVAGMVGNPFAWSGLEGTETIFPWLTYHVGPEPVPMPGKIRRYARISNQNVGDFRWLCDGSGSDLSRTERLLQLMLSLIEVPAYHHPIRGTVASGLLNHEQVVSQFLAEIPPSDNIMIKGPWLVLRRTATITLWESVPPKNILAARRG